MAVSLAAFDRMYTRMGSQLTDADVAGESNYNEALPAVVAELQDAGLLTESDGALCAFLPGFTGRDGAPLPLIVRKPTAASGTTPPTWPPSGSGSTSSGPTGLSTWWMPDSRCTSTRSSHWPGLRAGTRPGDRPARGLRHRARS